ncbi:hypothetical protein [Streptomyces sp. SID13031]|uniref:hypothetical protein n=1 Tax=Streptomyces sp. SID13031 TaxID=2706046 RepID=UPI0013CA02ED|nr:hypothetical protein [Streptomyces sp. SID13031]NEA30139.1 hypothetical protein [Streptomyces sp. SID13031]
MSTPLNEPLDAPPYPTAGNRTADADAAGIGNHARTTDAERPEYSVDEVGDDQAPLDTVTEPVAYPAGVEPEPATEATPPTSEAVTDEPLVPTTEGVDFKARWDVIQQGFVDDPRSAVTDADKLVGEVLDRLSATFDEQHRTLEGQWSTGEPSTEDLRSALQKYRAFFQRLLTI